MVGVLTGLRTGLPVSVSGIGLCGLFKAPWSLLLPVGHCIESKVIVCDQLIMSSLLHNLPSSNTKDPVGLFALKRWACDSGATRQNCCSASGGFLGLASVRAEVASSRMTTLGLVRTAGQSWPLPLAWRDVRRRQPRSGSQSTIHSLYGRASSWRFSALLQNSVQLSRPSVRLTRTVV